jgi:hypothetical protein
MQAEHFFMEGLLKNIKYAFMNVKRVLIFIFWVLYWLIKSTVILFIQYAR